MRAPGLIAVLLFVAAGCKAGSKDDHANPSRPGVKTGMDSDPGGMSSGGMSQGSGGQDAHAGSGGSGSSHPQPGSGAGGASHMQQGSGGELSSGAHDAGAASEADAAPVPDSGALMPGMGSCCMEHDTPGCSNADLEVCVCEKLTDCCTDTWSAACVLIVQQKYCQPGVRDCVCGSGDGQWDQPDCCMTDWSDTFCDEVAMSHCGAQPGCL